MAKDSSFTTQDADMALEDEGLSEKLGTRKDQRDMARMGKDQQLNVSSQSESGFETDSAPSNHNTSETSAFSRYWDSPVC